jgi:hypothetical protein
MSVISALRNVLIWVATVNAPTQPVATSGPAENKVTIQGHVKGVMEVDPPRLDLEVKNERYTIRLTGRTKVSKLGKTVEFKDLREKQEVVIVGIRPDKDKPLHVVADEVKILK